MAIESKWNIKEASDSELVKRLTAELGIDQILADMLVKRGVTTFEQARDFFRPSLDKLHDPFLMQDMDKAVERLHIALSTNEKILVYGDYDVDGTTAVALVYSFLKRFTNNLDFYIPDRYDEGYGVSTKGINRAAEMGAKLIITLDCGIKAIEKVAYAKTKGIDMIICDHHLPEDSIPEAIAVLDPKREDCHYPFDDLSGCGVGFKLVQAYSQRYRIDFESLIPLLDLLVVSISSDLVSMVGENRVLSYFGLKQLNENPCTGLLAMINLASIDQGHVTIDDIVFKIGPRINAAGRMESGRLAVELLTAADMSQASAIAEKINENNNDRKNIDREITKEALEMVENGTCVTKDNLTIVYNPNWNKGVVGIVASRLVEAYYKPTVVLTKSNGFISGSARSIPGFDLYDALETCADLLESFGGHVYAAGLTFKEEYLEEFAARMEKAVCERMQKEVQTPIEEIDAVLDFSRITPKFFRILKQFQPFGPGNNNPIFMTENVYDSGSSRKVGAAGAHIKLDLIQEAQPYRQIPAIAFNMSKHFDYLREGNPMDICYTIVENFYRGSSSIQLRVRDMKEREEIL